MLKNFIRNMNNNYLILSEDGLCTINPDYRLKMLMHNDIQPLLPFTITYKDNSPNFSYRITGRQPLTLLLENKKLTYDDFFNIISSLKLMIENIDTYILDINCVLLMPELIYAEPETFSLSFCYYPLHDGNFHEAFKELFRFFLNHIDHGDEKCIIRAYGIQQASMRNDLSYLQILDECLHAHSEAEETPLADIPATDFPEANKAAGIPKADRAAADFPGIGRTSAGRAVADFPGIGRRLLSSAPASHAPASHAPASLTSSASSVSCSGFSGFSMPPSSVGREEINFNIKTFLPYGICLIVSFLLLIFFTLNLFALRLFSPLPAFILTVICLSAFIYTINMCIKSKETFMNVRITEEIIPAEPQMPAGIFSKNMTATPGIAHGTNITAGPGMTSGTNIANGPGITSGTNIANGPDIASEDVFGRTMLLYTQKSAEDYSRACTLLYSGNEDFEDIIIKEFPFTIGKFSTSSGCIIRHPLISRLHARIDYDPSENTYLMEDLNSTNGTFLNDTPLAPNTPASIKSGDKISFSQINYIFKC